MAQETRSYSVRQYMTALKQKVETTPAVWVHGVITQISEKPKVVYMSIADFEEGSVIPQATVSLTCFGAKFAAIKAKVASFDNPFEIKPQLKVQLLIKAEVYVPYGKLQAQILDIDPVYTLGELALTKSAILRKLATEGLLDKNKSVEFAEMPLRVGLITGEGTAAYRDFSTKLAESPFAFHVVPAFAKMQGNETESSVIEALEALRADTELDVVCIVRGGGSKTDLTFFDSEALCRAVANYPVPVFTGIGHEIDRSLLDEVAYQACITPTDCAKRLIERASESWEAMVRAARDIAEGARDCLGTYSAGLTSVGHRLQQILSKRFLEEKTTLAQIAVSLKKDMHFLFQSETGRLQRNADGLRQGTRKIIEFEKARFELSEQKVKSADPKQVLAKGYTLTLNANGKFIRNASELKPGDRITTRFRGGDVTSQVL
ncbi:MAG: exodeoxyribonuclease VII large subunit [Fibrobacter sp.]|uniref:exodeoxyribonuclease VII large subunit n=1 Tax=Fibrobacter sp. TaxID=35828 RepID=UPI001B1500FE|nr:exodeoxyribonuclease VII large subunit [Fibrobacter sp.]MBO7060388.1 exodeoxyribonuclease VII large subunit [Fibrobacter sp.]